jgi:hypothetical protein
MLRQLSLARLGRGKVSSLLQLSSCRGNDWYFTSMPEYLSLIISKSNVPGQEKLSIVWKRA